jgi:hypothetical protein
MRTVVSVRPKMKIRTCVCDGEFKSSVTDREDSDTLLRIYYDVGSSEPAIGPVSYAENVARRCATVGADNL